MGDRQCRVIDEFSARRGVAVHRVAEHSGVALGLQQQRRGAAVVQLQVQQQAAQRAAHAGRMPHQLAQGAEAVEGKALPHQQAEVQAVRDPGAFAEQPAGCFER